MTAPDSTDMGNLSTPSADLIAEYLHYLSLRSFSPRTIRARSEILPRADRELPFGLDGSDETEVFRWIHQERFNAQTRATYYGALHSFYQFHLNRNLDWDPTQNIPRPKVPAGVPRPARDEDVRRIITEAAEPFRLWGTLATYAGLRCIEISRLKREDMTSKLIYVLGKGNKPDTVDMHPMIWRAVVDLPPGPITSRDERYISIQSAVYFRRRLGVPVSMHMLRHKFLTDILEMTGDVRLAQVLARHASLNTTMGYLKVSDHRRRAAVLALPSLSQDGADGADQA